MKRSWLDSIRLCVAFVCVFGISGLGTVAAAQRSDVWTELGESFTGPSALTEGSPIVGDTYVLPTSGAEVVLAEGLEPESSDFEDQLIIDTPQGMGAIGVLQGLASPQNVLETYANSFGESLGGAEEIDVHGDREFAFGLYTVDLLGVPVFMFITVDAISFPGYSTIQVVIAENDIAGAIVHFRENVAINDQPMFAGIDEQEIQEIADQYSGA